MADYAGISVFDVVQLDVFVYWTLLHDAVVYMYSKTEEGEEYLRNAWRLEQVEPDVGKLREKYGKKNESGDIDGGRKQRSTA